MFEHRSNFSHIIDNILKQSSTLLIFVNIFLADEFLFWRLEFKPQLKYGWFHLKFYSIFQDLSRRSIETGFGGIWDAA